MMSSGNSGPKIEYVGGYHEDWKPNYVLTETVTYGGLLTGGLASSPQAGDLVVVFVYFKYIGDATGGITISGYTKQSATYVENTWITNHLVFYKILTAADTTIDFASGGAYAYPMYGFQVFRNTSATTPIADEAIATRTDGLVDPAGVVKTNSRQWICVGGVNVGGGGAAPEDEWALELTTTELDNFLTGGQKNYKAGTGYSASVSDPVQFGGGNAGTELSSAVSTLLINPSDL